jgi:hypothetical protein
VASKTLMIVQLFEHGRGGGIDEDRLFVAVRIISKPHRRSLYPDVPNN